MVLFTGLCDGPSAGLFGRRHRSAGVFSWHPPRVVSALANCSCMLRRRVVRHSHSFKQVVLAWSLATSIVYGNCRICVRSHGQNDIATRVVELTIQSSRRADARGLSQALDRKRVAMRTRDKIATFIYWLVAALLLGLLVFIAIANQIGGFEPWEIVAAGLGLLCLALGLRQCWRSLRNSGDDNAI